MKLPLWRISRDKALLLVWLVVLAMGAMFVVAIMAGFLVIRV